MPNPGPYDHITNQIIDAAFSAIGPLRALVDSLDQLGAAVLRDDQTAYLTALAEARRCQASDEQIKDAWQWSAGRRLREQPHSRPVTFNWRGEKPTYPTGDAS